MKNLATGLLALAFAGIATVYFATQKMVAIQGPGTLQVVDNRTVWLVVNDELWTLDDTGRKTGQRTVGQLGLTQAVSNMALAPGGQALLTSRGDPSWQVVNTADLSHVRTITPQWPAEFQGKSLRALHVAVTADWHIAVATGGGHSVLLFDRDGQLKAQTAPGTYYFTNGLWHSPKGWWTTDTNRAVLRLLDSETLAVKESIELADRAGGYSALGELIPSSGDPLPGTLAYPVATVSRVGALMEAGHAVDVFADGRQAAFNKEPFAKLRDMAWFNKTLLIVDGGTYRVLQYGADRSALGHFGDALVNRRLQQMRADRTFWENLASRYALLAAAVMLLAGSAAYGRHKTLAAQAVGAEADMRVLPLRAMPPVGREARLRRWREITASLFVPGLGQWMQNRFVAGTLLFTVGGVLVLVVVGPLLWAAAGPKMHVDAASKAYALLWWVTLATVAATDAFYFGDARKR